MKLGDIRQAVIKERTLVAGLGLMDMNNSTRLALMSSRAALKGVIPQAET